MIFAFLFLTYLTQCASLLGPFILLQNLLTFEVSPHHPAQCLSSFFFNVYVGDLDSL